MGLTDTAGQEGDGHTHDVDDGTGLDKHPASNSVAVWCVSPRLAYAFERITVNPEVMGGVPTLRGLRIPVATVVAMVADGLTVDEIITDLPDLVADDVREALRYAAELTRERHVALHAVA